MTTTSQTETLERTTFFIGGEWTSPAGEGTIEVIDPTTEEVIGRVPEGTPEDVDRAVAAARQAFEVWSQVPVEVKPSEVTPLNGYLLAEVMEEVGLPAGVFNLIGGYGPVGGEAMSSRPDIDMMSFTGSTVAGRRVAANAAETVKRVALELGG